VRACFCGKVLSFFIVWISNMPLSSRGETACWIACCNHRCHDELLFYSFDSLILVALCNGSDHAFRVGAARGSQIRAHFGCDESALWRIAQQYAVVSSKRINANGIVRSRQCPNFARKLDRMNRGVPSPLLDGKGGRNNSLLDCL
jgi:hypothetical protein